ncbi:amino acid ABC transporter permease [Rhodoligotrophos ferricapiens]|uniref:amino acid ABC transporter permease n=1 Tax=Rhodoligotrophos ferricapiens TaxID=3069264 RepID=UPI00315D7192
MSFDPSVILGNAGLFAHGLLVTVAICAAALPLGFIGGVLLALALLSGRRILALPALALIELVRNIPFLIQIFLVFFGLPFLGIRLSPQVVGIAMLAVYASGYFAEIVRGAILSVPAGQREAATALGMHRGLAFRKVIFPQLLGYLIPASANLTITLIKESAVLSIITVAELTYISQMIIGRTFAPAEVFLTIALLYWALTAAVAGALDLIERRTSRFRRLERGREQIATIH